MEANEVQTPPGIGIKRCPVCNSTVFEDMSLCFNCMYSFGSNPAVEERARNSMSAQSVQTVAQYRSNASEGERDTEGSNTGDQVSAGHNAGINNAIDYLPSQIARTACNCANGKCESLADAFLVEFSRFLGKFIADRQVGIK